MNVLSPAVPAAEIERRHTALRQRLAAAFPDWQVALLTRKTSIYYLAGTAAAGALVLRREGEPVLLARKGYGRAVLESSLREPVRPMRNFRDVSEVFQAAGEALPETALLEYDSLTLAEWQFMQKYLPFKETLPLQNELAATMAEKSEFEIALCRRAGELNRRLQEELVPGWLRPGISEAELGGLLLAEILKAGGSAFSRMRAPGAEALLGYVNFGENSLLAANYDGPDGGRGMAAAAPYLGAASRQLQRGDLVFIDCAVAVEGYHTDKTTVYSFQAEPAAALVAAQEMCLEINHRAVAALRPGKTTGEVFTAAATALPEEAAADFMGPPGQPAKFLGHGCGLFIDELPVIAAGGATSLTANMTVAIEPKYPIAGVGLAGVENTYLVGAAGGESLTGAAAAIMLCG